MYAWHQHSTVNQLYLNSESSADKKLFPLDVHPFSNSKQKLQAFNQ